MGIKEDILQAKSKIEVIKRTNDQVGDVKKSTYDTASKNLSDLTKLPSKKLSDFASKLSKKNESGKDVFENLMSVVEGFVSTKPINSPQHNSKLYSKSKLKDMATKSMNNTIKSAMQIILDSANEIFFVGNNSICGVNKTFDGLGITPTTIVNISPSEFDFLNVLKSNPTSTIGKVVYEKSTDGQGYIKMNTNLYNTINTGTTFSPITGKTSDKLFDIKWDTANQRYSISGLTTTGSPKTLATFMNNYYSSIEPLNITGVTSQALQMTLNGTGDEPLGLTLGMNDLNRLLNKLCPFCGNSSSATSTLNQNTTTEFNENDEDIDSFFDFDAVEGIDIDSETDRLNKVLRFKDCNNFMITTNPTHFEDFITLLPYKKLSQSVDDILAHTSADVYNQSNGGESTGGFNLEDIHVNLMNMYILNLPKAIIASVLTPKFILPIILLYKILVIGINNTLGKAKDFMKKLSKLFFKIIQKLLWKFINEFWKLAKVELLNFLKNMILRIIKNKKKRYIRIIKTLIALITKILAFASLADCKNLFKTINDVIRRSLNDSGFSGPFYDSSANSLLLSISYMGGGYSEDRAVMNIMENLNDAGFVTGPVYGSPNDTALFIQSIIFGHTQEMDEHSYVASGNMAAVLPVPGLSGPVPVIPGQIKSMGKVY
jgi:hypothetical protein